MKHRKGFTLPELLLVVSISFVVGALVIPMSITFLNQQILEDTSRNLTNILRKAQLEAMYAKHDLPSGVKMGTNEYVLFEGESYAARVVSEDLSFDMPQGLVVSGLTEVVFALYSGEPSATGTILLTHNNGTSTIIIGHTGSIQ